MVFSTPNICYKHFKYVIFRLFWDSLLWEQIGLLPWLKKPLVREQTPFFVYFRRLTNKTQYFTLEYQFCKSMEGLNSWNEYTRLKYSKNRISSSFSLFFLLWFAFKTEQVGYYLKFCLVCKLKLLFTQNRLFDLVYCNENKS